MMGVGAKRALGLYRSCAPRHLLVAAQAGLEFVCVFGQDGLRLSILLWIDRLVCFAELAHDPVFDPLAAPPIDRCDSGTVQERREVQVIATR